MCKSFSPKSPAYFHKPTRTNSINRMQNIIIIKRRRYDQHGIT